MWISQGTWLNQLPWNNFRIIYGEHYHLYFQYIVTVQSERLGIYGLNKDRLKRLQLIHYLAETGMSVSQISAYLNLNNLKTLSGLSYYPKLVWITLSKYRKRLTRFCKDKRVRIRESIVVLYRSKN
jgi:hypothetical protein